MSKFTKSISIIGTIALTSTLMLGSSVLAAATPTASLTQSKQTTTSSKQLASVSNQFATWMDVYLFPAPHGGIKALDTVTPMYKSQGGVTLSGEQAYAMLFAADLHARYSFAHLWRYAQTEFGRNGLMHAEIAANGKVLQSQSFARADLDMALSLLIAGQTWHDKAYTAAGVKMANAVYEHEVNSLHQVMNSDGGSHRVPFGALYLPTSDFAYLAKETGNNGWLAVGKVNGASMAAIQERIAAAVKMEPKNTGMNATLKLWSDVLRIQQQM